MLLFPLPITCVLTFFTILIIAGIVCLWEFPCTDDELSPQLYQSLLTVALIFIWILGGFLATLIYKMREERVLNHFRISLAEDITDPLSPDYNNSFRSQLNVNASEGESLLQAKNAS